MQKNVLRTLWSLMMVVMFAACGGGDDSTSNNSNSGSGSGSNSGQTNQNPDAKDPVFLEFKLSGSGNSTYLYSDVKCSISNTKYQVSYLCRYYFDSIV